MGEEIKQVSFIPEGNLEHVYRKHSGKGETITLLLNCVRSWKRGSDVIVVSVWLFLRQTSHNKAVVYAGLQVQSYNNHQHGIEWKLTSLQSIKPLHDATHNDYITLQGSSWTEQVLPYYTVGVVCC